MSCPQCFTGHPKSGEPKGQVSVIHGRNTYVAQPEDEAVEIKGTIVIIPDVFGWEFVNNRLVADHYASQGAFKVYLPDFMDGTASPPWLLDVSAALFKTSKGWTDYLLLPCVFAFSLPPNIHFKVLLFLVLVYVYSVQCST